MSVVAPMIRTESDATARDGAVREERPVEARAAIWLLCHYPDHPETDERVDVAARLAQERGWPIWLCGSYAARYAAPIERLVREKLRRRGVPSDAIRCLSEDAPEALAMDTVQEAFSVAAAAREQGVRTLACVSNRLQLWQVRALLRREPLTFVWVPTRLRDRRWWYIGSRLLLIPLAALGVGPRFAPLVAVRWARRRVAAWPF